MRRIVLILVGVLLLHAGFIAGILVEREIVERGGVAEGDLPLTSALFNLVEEDFYASGVATPGASLEQSLDHGAASGMLGSLDPYSQFLPPKEARQAADELAGRYEGIGITAEFVDGALVVSSAVIGSPAEQAGIQAGDRIIAADGKPLASLAEEDAFGLVRGPVGTTVTLTIQRADRAAPIDIAVQRQAISVPVVSYRMLPGTAVALIQVTVFGDTTTGQLDEALKRAVADGATGLILDLRQNGGGWVQSAQEVIGRFVPEDKGPALYEDKTPAPGGEEAFAILGNDFEPSTLPMAVLVDAGTASAAEIVAGALQDYRRATVIGQQTFGKGSVQRVYEFEDGSSARITFAEWLTPDKHRIEGQGVRPDIVVPTASDATVVSDDPLQRALDLLSANKAPNPPATPLPSPGSSDG